jgi:hypothetical protein
LLIAPPLDAAHIFYDKISPGVVDRVSSKIEGAKAGQWESCIQDRCENFMRRTDITAEVPENGTRCQGLTVNPAYQTCGREHLLSLVMSYRGQLYSQLSHYA